MYIMDVKKLDAVAKKLRYDLVEMLAYAKSGHPGGSLSLIEILTTLYFGVMKCDPINPVMPDRDRFILSKGHGSPALYVVLAELGYFPRAWLKELDSSGSRLSRHADRFNVPGVEASTGALGQGLSVAIGMALAEKLDKKNNYRIYCVLGDGECDSGNIWEAAMTASKFKLDNLVAIVDRNKLQLDGFTEDVMPLYPLDKKFGSFGWCTFKADGHDVSDLLKKIKKAKRLKGKPSMIIADTVKGKGVSFMENKVEWHGAPLTPELAEIALKELRKEMENG